MKMTNFTIRIDSKQRSYITKKAHIEDSNKGEVVRKLIDQQIKKQNNE
jgi:hypothetical protein